MLEKFRKTTLVFLADNANLENLEEFLIQVQSKYIM